MEYIRESVNPLFFLIALLLILLLSHRPRR